MSAIKNAPEGANANSSSANNSTNLSTEELLIQELIKKANSQRPVRRAELHRATGIDDRTVRYLIRKLRQRGERIISSAKGGYYYAENEQQYKGWRNSILSRIIDMNIMVRAMDGATEGQIDMEEI